MDQTDLESKDKDCYASELENQANFSLQVEVELDQYGVLNKDQQSCAQSEISSQKLVQLMSQMSLGESRQLLWIVEHFLGKKRIKFASNNFLNQLNNVIGPRKHLAYACKLAYLSPSLRVAQHTTSGIYGIPTLTSFETLPQIIPKWAPVGLVRL